MMTRRHVWIAAIGFAAACAGAVSPSLAAEPTVKIGLPGIPSIFVTVQAYVAQQQKFFEKYGVKAEMRPFDTGANAARAVVAGDVDLSLSPTPLVVNMISNAKADMVAIYGYEKPDYVLASTTPGKKCEDVKGQPVGVDAVGGARSIALSALIRSCGLTGKDTQQVAMSSNVGTAMASGQLTYGVLHIDDIPVIEREAKKKLDIMLEINKVQPVNHYMSVVTSRKKVASERAALVGAVAALIEAGRFMEDPKNADAVAAAAGPTGRAPADAKSSTEEYLKLGFWPMKSAGLPEKNIDGVIAVQKKVGGIREGSTPVTYAQMVDTSIYDDAVKLVNSKK